MPEPRSKISLDEQMRRTGEAVDQAEQAVVARIVTDLVAERWPILIDTGLLAEHYPREEICAIAKRHFDSGLELRAVEEATVVEVGRGLRERFGEMLS